MNNVNSKIAFIGGGNMAQAIIRGLLAAGHPANHIFVTDPDARQREALQTLSGNINVSAGNNDAAAAADVIVLAVKPQIIAKVASDLAQTIQPERQLVISIAAGTTLQSLQESFGPDVRLVRVMPNQPALVGQGMSGLCATENVGAQARDQASYVMGAAGQLRWFNDEAMIDPLTAVSGSGPAYFYLVMEILQDVAQEFGFDSTTARQLSVQTALGAAEVAISSDESLAQLRERVTSPGGTTAAALAELEAAGIRDIFRTALEAARNRSIELGQISTPDK
jgi:pyrroline-5-carboxylate reductase